MAEMHKMSLTCSDKNKRLANGDHENKSTSTYTKPSFVFALNCCFQGQQ